MPELVAIGFVGAILTFICVNLNLYKVHKSFQNPKFLMLNHNLNSVQMYWSQERGQLLKVKDGRSQSEYQKQDYEKSTKSAFLFGTILIFMSWLGLFLFLIYYFSITKLARPRLEKDLFESPLAQKDLMDANRVQALLKSLNVGS